MPPLSLCGVARYAESTGVLHRRAFSLPRCFRASSLPTKAQGSGLAALLTPHSWHEHTGRTAKKPQPPGDA